MFKLKICKIMFFFIIDLVTCYEYDILQWFKFIRNGSLISGKKFYPIREKSFNILTLQ